LTALCFVVGQAHAGDWYRWRGPEQDGVSREKNIVGTWSPEGENLIWKNDVGGMSSPIVMNGKVYTISRSGEVAAGGEAGETVKPGPMTQETYVCVDANTGKVLWRHFENMTQTDVPFHRIGWSNPVGDPKTNRVYFFGCQCTFLCLDGDSGKVIWKRQMTEEFGTISTFGGRTPSPAIEEEQVFVAGISFGWGENSRGQHRIFAFNKNTGELNWSAPTGGVPVDAPQQTPVIAVINGERLVIFGAGDGGVHAFQARTGKKVWSQPLSKRGLNSSVIVDGTRVYACFDLENLDSATLGAVVCIECKTGKPEILWKDQGIEAGFPSGTIHGNVLYVEDNSAWVHCLDKMTGKRLWRLNCGRIGKASLVWVDNKLLVTEANGRFTVLDVSQEGKKPKDPHDPKVEPGTPHVVELPDKLGREYATYGTPAISNGRILLQCANQMFCIGNRDVKVESDPIPAMAEEAPEAYAKPAIVQVVPADAVMRPGEKKHFTARTFDQAGHLLSETKADWAIAPLMMPPIPKPGERPDPNVKPNPVGNLKGEVDGEGNFTAAPGPLQGGAVAAKVGEVTGHARVRVMPALPWKIDFEQALVEKPPLTWTGAGGKFSVVDLDGNKCLVKLIDPPGVVSIPPKALYARARTNYGSVDMHDYTVQADVRVTATIVSENVFKMPDAGVIDQRYVLELQGSTQTLNIHVWQYAMPDYTSKSIAFSWKKDTWYRLKLQVAQAGEKASLKGKAWQADQPEPDKWMIELEDPNPNRNGNPGLWGFSNDHEIYYDNIVVTPNEK
jgi:outer membrane protein assembly factor BamB